MWIGLLGCVAADLVESDAPPDAPGEEARAWPRPVEASAFGGADGLHGAWSADDSGEIVAPRPEAGRTVIIGAGAAGLAAAMEIGGPLVLLEADAEAGGRA